MNKQNIIGLALLVISLLIGLIVDASIATRIYLGLALGYVLVRGAYGFAGSINRAYRFNSLNLMRSLMDMFMITAVLVAILLLVTDISAYGLWINQINAGLIIGGILFGFGMAFASCCASGVMTDGVSNPTKLIIVTLGFGLGILLGFPLQTGASWVAEGPTVAFFEISDNLVIGMIFAVAITVALSFLVKFITKKIDQKWEKEGKTPNCPAENDENVKKETNKAKNKF